MTGSPWLLNYEVYNNSKSSSAQHLPDRGHLVGFLDKIMKIRHHISILRERFCIFS